MCQHTNPGVADLPFSIGYWKFTKSPEGPVSGENLFFTL